jgi:hypothetical protein
MLANSREEIVDVFDALQTAVSRLVGLSFETLTTPERLGFLERLEEETRRLPVPRHALINGVRREATAAELGGKLPHVLADRLRITRAEAARRIDEAAVLGQRSALTGELLAPQLPATAAVQRGGKIGSAHVRMIRGFLRELPCWVDADTRAHAEAQLADLATQYRPEQLGKLAAPGVADPYVEEPVLDGTPSQDVIDCDTRSPAQRNHDGLHAALRAVLASGSLGQHNGLPASIIVSTTLEELEAAAGTAVTGGGIRLPIKDVIRLAAHAHHYLAIFGKGKVLGLYHTKRLASPGQRIVLYAKDRGCSHPGCDVPGYLCEVHHVTDFAKCRTTEMDDLTLACGSHHALIKPGGWTTRKGADGETEWIPPPHLDRGQPRTNTYWPPEKLLRDADGDDAP